MEKNINSNQLLITVTLLILIVVSIFVISPLVSKSEFHSRTISILDEKKIKIVNWITGSVGVATALATVPGDATTPLSNQILELSSYFIIVIGAIFLEKILLTLTGSLAFTILLPIACFLFIIYLYTNKNIIKILAIKLGVFGLLLFLIVPISVKISNLIENTYQVSLNQSIDELNIIANEEDNSKTDKTGLEAITSKIQDTIADVGNAASNTVKKGEQMVSNLIDTIAVFIITSCVIPIITLLTFVWIIKIIFNVTIPISNFRGETKKTYQK